MNTNQKNSNTRPQATRTGQARRPSANQNHTYVSNGHIFNRNILNEIAEAAGVTLASSPMVAVSSADPMNETARFVSVASNIGDAAELFNNVLASSSAPTACDLRTAQRCDLDAADTQMWDAFVLGMVRVGATLFAPYLQPVPPGDRESVIAAVCFRDDVVASPIVTAIAGHLVRWAVLIPGPDWSVPTSSEVDMDMPYDSTPAWVSAEGEVVCDWIDLAESMRPLTETDPEAQMLFVAWRNRVGDYFAGVRHIVTHRDDTKVTNDRATLASSRWYPTPHISVPLTAPLDSNKATVR